MTVILCWSAAEAARYLELYKSYENANFSAIRGQQSSNYADKLVEFVTVPRSLNKSDAVALVANFGSLKNAINAEPEQLSMISGWGGAKVKRWTSAVEEPFRARKAAKRGFQPSSSSAVAGRDSRAVPAIADTDRPSGSDAEKSASGPPTKVTSHASSSKYGSPGGSAPGRQPGSTQPPAQFHFLDEDDDSDEEEAFATMSRGEEQAPSQPTNQPQEERQPNKESSQLSEGVAAALAKLRQNG